MRENEFEDGYVNYLGTFAVRLGADDFTHPCAPFDIRRWETMVIEVITTDGTAASGELQVSFETAISTNPRSEWARDGAVTDLAASGGTTTLQLTGSNAPLRNWGRIKIAGRSSLSAPKLGTFELRWTGKKRAQ